MHWWKLPTAGEIVWCHFPQHPDLEPGPKSRPGLLVTVFDSPQQQYTVRVAYGTSQRVDQLFSGEFRIHPEDGAAFAASGLSFPTKFDLRNLVDLPYNEDYFSPPPGMPYGRLPKLGTLHPILVKRVQAAREAARN